MSIKTTKKFELNPLYLIIHFLVRLTLPLYYKKIHVSGLQNIPKHKPILIAANHQNAFLDGVLIAYKMKKQIYFLARSDAFKGKLAAKILKAMNLVPIYRSQDGTGVENNAQVFEWCYKTMAKNRCVLIFPEGTCEPHKYMFPLKKGMARIAFGALDVYAEMDLYVLPVGLNYDDHMAFRSQVWIDYGTAVSVQNIASKISTSGERIKELTHEVEKELRSMVVHLNKENYEQENKNLKSIIELHKPSSGKELVGLQKRNTKKINQKTKNSFYSLLAIPFLIIHQPIYYFIDWLTLKFTGKNEFYPSVKYTLLILVFPTCWLTFSLVICLFLKLSFLKTLVVFILFPLSAYFGLKLKEFSIAYN